MGHKYSHNSNIVSEHQQDFNAKSTSSPNSARFTSNTSSPRTCNTGLDACQSCKDTNTTCVMSKQERRFNQLLLLCQAFEDQYPEVWKQFIIQYYLTANFKFPQKRKRKMSSSHDSAPGKLVSSSLDDHSNVTFSNNCSSFKVSSLPSGSNPTSTSQFSQQQTFVHHSYSLGSLNDPNSNIMVNSNDAMITDKVVHLPESVRKEIEKIDRRMCSTSSQDFDLSSDEEMFPNVEIGNNIACEGGDRNPQYGQVVDQFMRDFIEYNLKHWKIPNKLEDVNMVKIFEDFLKYLNK